LLLAAATGVLAAGNEPPTTQGSKVDGVPAGKKGEWVEVPITIGKTKGLMCGVAVDRTTGEVYVLPLRVVLHGENAGLGVWKSTDHAATFMRADNGEINGGCGVWGGMDMDPAGGKLAIFVMYGYCGVTLDSGKTWRRLTPGSPPPDRHGEDWGCVDWDDPQAQTMMMIRHEAGPPYNVSSDGGKTWTPLPLNSGGIGVVDAKTLLSFDNGIRRSEDLGKTWTPVSKERVSSLVMRKFKGVCYLIGQKGLLVSKDKGLTWTVQGEPIPGGAAGGPIFGKDENHIIVAAKNSIQETTDGGKTWKAVAPLPPGFEKSSQFPFSYDPKGDIFYITLPNTPMFYRYER
jgi:hypothetical protein